MRFTIRGVEPDSTFKVKHAHYPSDGATRKYVTECCGVIREKKEISFNSALDRRDASKGMVLHEFGLGPRGSRVLRRRKGEAKKT